MVRLPDDFEEDVVGEIRPDRGIEVLHIRDFVVTLGELVTA